MHDNFAKPCTPAVKSNEKRLLMSKAKDDNDLLKAGEYGGPMADIEPMLVPTDDSMVNQGARVDIGEVLDAALARMKRRYEGAEVPIPVPWPSIAEPLGGGLWPGLHVLVGNTGSGKSQFALQLSLEAARKAVPVLYIGLELDYIGLVARLLSLLTLRHKWSDLYLGKANAITDLLELNFAAVEQLRSLPVQIQVAPPNGWDYSNLLAAAQGLRKQFPEKIGDEGKPIRGSRPFLIVLDFLQLVSGDERELRERIGKAAYAGRMIAREMDAAVLLISSTARENYGTLENQPRTKNGDVPKIKDALGRGSPTRLVGLGKESGEIEFAADTVLVLAREPWPEDAETGKPIPPTDGTHCWLAIAKIRAGLPSWAELRFDGKR